MIDGPVHPVDVFLAVWGARGGRDGVDLRTRVYAALAADGPWTRERLRVTLRSLLAFGRDEQSRFDRCFVEFFPGDESPGWLRARLDAELDRDVALAELRSLTPHRPRPPTLTIPWPVPKPARLIPRRAPVVVLVAMFSIAVVGAGWWAFTRPPPPDLDPPRLLTHTGTPPPADGGAVQVGEFPITKIERAPSVSTVSSAAPLSIVEARTLLVILLLVASLVFADALVAAWMFRPPRTEAIKPLETVPPDAELDQRQIDFRSPTALTPPLDADALDRLALRTGFASDVERPELDLHATVSATARGGGLLEVVHRPGRRAATLRVSRPRELDPVAASVISTFVSGMRARGLTVLEVFDLPGEAPADLNLVALDARWWDAGARDAWRRVPHVAHLELRDPALWDDAVARLPAGVFSLDLDGLEAAIDAARDARPPKPAENLPIGDTRARLGDAFALAAAASLIGPFDLPTLDRLRRDLTPELSFLALQRVLTLDGVSGGPGLWVMSPSLRAWLGERLDVDAPLRGKTLDWQQDRLKSLKRPPEGSRASHVMKMQTLWVELQRGLLSVAAIEAWVARAEVFLGHPVLAEVFHAQRRQIPSPSLAPVTSPTLRERLVRLAMLPQLVRLSRAGWISLGLATALSLVVVSGATWKMSRLRVPVLSLSTRIVSDPLRGGRTHPTHSRCAGGAIVGFGPDGAPACRSIELDVSTPSPTVHLGELRGTTGAWILGAIAIGDSAPACPLGEAVVGIEGDYGYAPGAFASGETVTMRLRCARPERGSVGGVVMWSEQNSLVPVPLTSRAAGLSQRSPFWFNCRPAGFVIGLIRYEGSWANVGVECGSLALSR